MRQASSIILQSDWEHKVSHDKAPVDDYFQRESVVSEFIFAIP